MNIAKLLRAPNFKKICKQLLLQFLLLTDNIFLRGLLSALNSVSLFSSRSSLRFKEFSLGCLVVDSSLIRKKEELAKMATRCHTLSLILPLVVIRCHSLSLFVTRCTTRLSFYKRSFFLMHINRRRIPNIYIKTITAGKKDSLKKIVWSENSRFYRFENFL